MNALPPVRDLPEQRHDEIRARLVETVGSGGARPSSSWLQPTIAAAAVAAAAAGVGIVSFDTGGHDVAAPPKPTAKPSTLSPMSAQERDAFVAKCVKSSGIPAKGAAGYQMRTAFEDKAGVLAVVTNKAKPHVELACERPRGRSGVDGANMMDEGSIRPLHVVVVDTAESYDDPYPTEYAAGRVSAQVKRVTYTSGGHSVDAAVGDGAFAVRVLFDSAGDLPKTAQWTVKAFDKDGKLIGVDTAGKADDAESAQWPDADAPASPPSADGTNAERERMIKQLEAKKAELERAKAKAEREKAKRKAGH